ncbi:uncharacterized protein [Bactrocera oleae]|uniref:uncharacterized protein n=1 Tax=Bactrocera oleae TaxID=104688 RepID=UPI0006B6B9CB|nr:uncharacterized protein LOC106624823 [Bactrocera oleae]
MEQLSRADYARLSATERKLLEEHGRDSSRVSVSDDEDWIPAKRARHQNQQDNSVSDEPEDSEDTEEIAEDNSAVEEEVESSESEDDDNEVETAAPKAQEPSGSFIAKDKTVWNKTPPTQHRLLLIMFYASGVGLIALRKRCQLARLSKKILPTKWLI